MTNAPQTTHSLPDPSKNRLRLWLRLLKANRLIEAELRERLRVSFDTTLPRFDVMSALYRNRDGLKMSELSRMLMVSNGNVTGIVDRLATDGLMIREAVPGDKRAMRVRLTQKGIEAFTQQAAAHESWVSELLGSLDGDTCAHMNAILDDALPTQKELPDD